MAQALRALGPVEQEILDVIWQHGGGTARDIYKRVCDRTPIAFPTVLVMLARLVGSGLLTQKDGPSGTYVYTPAITQAS